MGWRFGTIRVNVLCQQSFLPHEEFFLRYTDCYEEPRVYVDTVVDGHRGGDDFSGGDYGIVWTGDPSR